MIRYETALRRVLARAAPLPEDRVPPADALGAGLTRPFRARFDLPRFDQSAMDGFGVRVADVAGAGPRSPVRLPVVRTIRAGDPPGGRVPLGTAVKLLTGGPVPRGVEAVVAREFCRETGTSVRVGRSARPGEHIRRKGEETRAGSEVFPAGTAVTPPVAGVLASFGVETVRVPRPPRVSLLVTGNELTPAGIRLGPGGIYDSNTTTLTSALAEVGARTEARRVGDDREETIGAAKAALESRPDVLLAVGGVSVGDYDFVKEALEDRGVARVFWRVRMKPGKPNYFGVCGRRRRGGKPFPRTLVFGLPGNPVSALISYLLFVRPALLALRGRSDVGPVTAPAVLSREVRRRPGREEWLRARLSPGDDALCAEPVSGQGSHMLTGIARVEGLIRLPADAEHLPAGASVTAWLLPWRR